jgi:hypothetical protein
MYTFLVISLARRSTSLPGRESSFRDIQIHLDKEQRTTPTPDPWTGHCQYDLSTSTEGPETRKRSNIKKEGQQKKDMKYKGKKKISWSIMTHDDHVKTELTRVDIEGEPSIIEKDSKNLAGIANEGQQNYKSNNTQKDCKMKSNLSNVANGDLKKENFKYSQNDDEVTADILNFKIKGQQQEHFLNIETESTHQIDVPIKDFKYHAEKMAISTGERALHRPESDKVEVTSDQAEVTLAQAEVTSDQAEVTLAQAEVTSDQAEVTLAQAEEELLEQEAESFFLLCSSIEISLEQYFDNR